MCAGVSMLRFTRCRTAGNDHGGGHGMGARRKGEELGTSAIGLETLSHMGMVVGMARWSSVSDLGQQATS
jgi:hypothetical protein